MFVQILDNCSIHTADDVFGAVVALLERYGVRMIRLPKYSPELNPCEPVWAQVSNQDVLCLVIGTEALLVTG